MVLCSFRLVQPEGIRRNCDGIQSWRFLLIELIYSRRLSPLQINVRPSHHRRTPCSMSARRPPRDPAAPKRNQSAYLLYQNAMRDTFKQQNPGMTFGQLSKYTSVSSGSFVELCRTHSPWKILIQIIICLSYANDRGWMTQYSKGYVCWNASSGKRSMESACWRWVFSIFCRMLLGTCLFL